ncbi:hypothetical protein ACSBR2_012498 [Camellia fascicularis]
MGSLSNGDLFDGSSNKRVFLIKPLPRGSTTGDNSAPLTFPAATTTFPNKSLNMSGNSNFTGLFTNCTSSGVSLKYKKRKVYAVHHFPHGCGQNASFINLMPHDTEVVASLGDKENLVADEKMVKVVEGDCVKASEMGNESSSRQLVESPVKLELPDILSDLLGKVVVAAGKVNGAELSPIVEPLGSGLIRNTLLKNAARTGIEELDRDVRDTNAKQRDMKKKLLPSGKASYENKGAQVVKDKGDFSICEQDEDSPAGQRPHDFQVILPPFGPDSLSHGNVHNKVRETQRLFQAICRKLLQGEEANLKKQGCLSRRPDLKAAQIIRARGKEVNTGKQIIGSVPEVDVGDEFQYRVELALVGIHRLYQAGIDYMKHGGMIIATSIVALGGYADDLDNPDVLIYSGHGGNITGRDKQQPERQKLERGNVALKNSISAKNPVRVIRGSKETKLSTLDARAKIVLAYTYDGLHTVERYMHDVGPHGKIPYNCNGAIVEAKPLVYECGPSCKCPPSCYNKVSQHGMKIQLEIFKTKSRGWGVRSLTSIPSGSFICEYIGELLEDKEAEKRQNDEYLFDIGHNFSDCSLIGLLLTLKPVVQLSSSEVVEDERFTIDAAECGNVGRFINHSCSPNLYAQNVLHDHEDKSKPHIMLFAAENIPPLKELTYHYNYFVNQVRDLNGNVKMKSCYCGAAECTGRMY